LPLTTRDELVLVASPFVADELFLAFFVVSEMANFGSLTP